MLIPLLLIPIKCWVFQTLVLHFVVASSGQFQTAMSLKAPYLFHGRELGSDENHDLADGTKWGVVEEVMLFKFYWLVILW